MGFPSRSFVPLLCAVAWLAACGGGQPPAEPAAAEPASKATQATESLPFREVEIHAFSGVGEHRDVAVNDVLGWSSVWTAHTANVAPAPARPEVDFARDTVAAIFLGKRTDCARPVAEVVERHGDARIVVQYRVAKPDAGATCPAVVMSPALMVAFENPTRMPVDFRQR